MNTFRNDRNLSSNVLIVQHVACEKPGRILAALASRKISSRTVRVFASESVPRSCRGIDGLVVMGGPMGVADLPRLTHLRAELRLIDDALAREIPVLGICLGSQLLAAALGADVTPGRRKEIGWFEVTLKRPAKSDPLFSGLPKRFTPLHWHGDIFDLPRGAVSLASSRLTRHQAFRHGNAYGLLFHLEATPAIVKGMVKSFPEELRAERLSGADIVAQSARRAATLDTLASRFFGKWADSLY